MILFFEQGPLKKYAGIKDPLNKLLPLKMRAEYHSKYFNTNFEIKIIEFCPFWKIKISKIKVVMIIGFK